MSIIDYKNTRYIKIKENKMKKFFEEFKKFITRGNVVDMAVGVIVGSSFTAIVNALSNNILKPIINFLLALIFGADSVSGILTFLKRVNTETGEADLTQSIYIDWGAFINAVLNFFLVAIVLFMIVKLFNMVREGHMKMQKEIKSQRLTKAERAEMKAACLNYNDLNAIKAYRADKKAKADAEAAEAKAKTEEEERIAKERAEYEAKSPERIEALLSDIKELLKK